METIFKIMASVTNIWLPWFRFQLTERQQSQDMEQIKREHKENKYNLDEGQIREQGYSESESLWNYLHEKSENKNSEHVHMVFMMNTIQNKLSFWCIVNKVINNNQHDKHIR